MQHVVPGFSESVQGGQPGVRVRDAVVYQCLPQACEQRRVPGLSEGLGESPLRAL